MVTGQKAESVDPVNLSQISDDL